MAVDPVLYSDLDVRKHRRSREGTPSRARGTAKMGVALDHGVTARHVAIRTLFQRRPYRVSMGYKRFRCKGCANGRLSRLHVLCLYSRVCDGLEKPSIPDALIHFAPEAVGAGEGRYQLCPVTAEAWVQRTSPCA